MSKFSLFRGLYESTIPSEVLLIFLNMDVFSMSC